MLPPKYPYFISEAKRDAYLDKLIGKGHRVRAIVVYGGMRYMLIADAPVAGDLDLVYFDELYTVEDIDKRVGK